MTASETSPLILHVDPEHTGVRMAVIASLVAGLWLFFQIVRAVVLRFAPPTWLPYTFAISCASAIPLALALTWVIENRLKRVWHSGEYVALDKSGLRFVTRANPLADTGTAVHEVTWSEHLNQIYWYFKLQGYPRRGREKRVPNKWLCLACELHQEDVRLVFFTYMQPSEAYKVIDGKTTEESFAEISLAQLYEDSDAKRQRSGARPELPASYLHGKNGRYWLAERRRWDEGGELTPDDFKRLLSFIERHARIEKEPESL